MAESFKSMRVIFPKRQQQAFLLATKSSLDLTDKQIVDFLHVSQRTLTDWKRERFSISLVAARKLSRKAKISIPDNVVVKPAFWSVKKAAKLGAKATIKKYGKICNDEAKRKKGWENWWQTKGRFIKRSVNQPKTVHLPKKSAKLAEFIGIMIGDGGITDYQITITLNKITDKQYTDFVHKLIRRLFRINASRNYRQSVVNLQISRKNLVKLLIKLGLKKGNKIKQEVDIPLWVKKKPNYCLACVRGLIDTDGSFYLHKYKSKGKAYIYQKIDFTSRSEELIKSVKEILRSFGLNPKIDCRGDIRLYSVKDVKRYFQVVGSNNPKHIQKFNKIYGEGASRYGRGLLNLARA